MSHNFPGCGERHAAAILGPCATAAAGSRQGTEGTKLLDVSRQSVYLDSTFRGFVLPFHLSGPFVGFPVPLYDAFPDIFTLELSCRGGKLTLANNGCSRLCISKGPVVQW